MFFLTQHTRCIHEKVTSSLRHVRDSDYVHGQICSREDVLAAFLSLLQRESKETVRWACKVLGILANN